MNKLMEVLYVSFNIYNSSEYYKYYKIVVVIPLVVKENMSLKGLIFTILSLMLVRILTMEVSIKEGYHHGYHTQDHQPSSCCRKIMSQN